MYCTKCGHELGERAKYCPECATPTPNATALDFRKPAHTLRRSRQHGKIAGVCAGLARYLDLDVTVVRIIAIILLFWPVPLVAGVAYLIAYWLMPEEAPATQAVQAPQRS